MKHIRLGFLALLLLLTLLWLAADGSVWTATGLFAVRGAFVQLTGILGMGVMSVAMILAVRPARVEPWLGGLDKSYRLHKWLGITGLVMSVVHWLWAQGPKWAVGFGWLERPARHIRAEPGSAVEQFLRSQRGLAEGMGEWAFYAIVLLIVLALAKRFPYRHFFKTHRLLAVVYLFLVFHAVVLLKMNYWGTPLGAFMGLLMWGGTIAAFISLLGRVGYRRRAVGAIAELEHQAKNQVLKVVIQLHERWSGHQAGQFAFLTFDRREGPHPFTIASAWQGDGRLVFHIKGLGDYTSALPQKLAVGDLVTAEGPYGCFDFRGRKPAQIWVAGGIGITPFIARMQALAEGNTDRTIDLFYSTNAPDTGFMPALRRLAEKARVRLHVFVTRQDGRLTAEQVRAAVPDWRQADLWFCGPNGLGSALREDLIAQGFSPKDFHQELFCMR